VAWYIVIGMSLAWFIYDPLIKPLFFDPFLRVAAKHPNWVIAFRNITGPFMLQLKVSIIAGMVLVIPGITLELWGFIAPGLTSNEKKVCRVVFPLAIFFFLFGIACGYWIMEPSLLWFADFFNRDFTLYQDPEMYITFLVKMVLAFGICFELPMVLMALSYVGIVSPRMLKEQWRLAIVGCAVIAAVATPSGDPFSMTVMTVPLIILYVASIFLCALVERFKAQGNPEASVALDSA
jgi:sec-independent protein translocase protein TatC